jgi:uncharacterized RDD family membrane protein YckC
MNWHYVEQGEKVGPVSETQLAELNRAGKINADTLVWCQGMSDWMPFRTVKLDQPPGMEPTNPAETKAPPPGEGNPDATEVVCAECGRTFPVNETIRHGKSHICAGCKPVFMQKLAEGAQINTGEMNYAGFGIRFGAKFLDGLIIGLPMIVIYFAIMFPYLRQNMHPNGVAPPPGFQVLPILLQCVFVLVQISYQTFFLGRFGATPGKMICKLQVVTAEGGRIGYGRAVGRAFAEMLSGMICYIGYFMVLFDGQKRALHDHICNTRVIQK